VKYLLVFNPKAKRYSRRAEAVIVDQARQVLGTPAIDVVHTVPQQYEKGWRYAIDDFVACSQDVDCVVAVGGDGTVNIVASALMRHGLHTRVPIGVVPYGTGNNLVRSFGLKRVSEKALHTIRQGYSVSLDVGVINQQYYFVNGSFGLFAYLLARRVTSSQFGWTYDALRHLGFTPWRTRIRYTDALGRTIELPQQHYILGALLNTSYYGSILHMAPDAISDDGLFDVKLLRAAPPLTYPFLFSVILTGQYELSRYTITFRASQLEIIPETSCSFEVDGDSLPSQRQYCVAVAGQVRLLVPSPAEGPWRY
jgi:diacylglycerol kinase family enzyme